MMASLTAKGQGTNCVEPPAGLISWWRAEGNALDHEGINHGTIMGGGGFAIGEVRRGFLFSGNGDDFVALPPNMFPFPSAGEGTGNTPFTFETWFRTSASGIILGQQDQPPFDTTIGGNVPGLYVGTDGDLYAQMFWGADIMLESPGLVADGVFHHAAVTYDGNVEVLYLDGAAIGSTSFTQQGYAGTYYYQFGTGWSDGWPATPGGWFPFNGMLDEPSLYARPLSAAEVAAIYHAASAGKCAPPDGPALVHRYSFSEPAGSAVARDSVSASDGLLLFATTNAPYTNGTSDGSDFTGTGKLTLQGTSGYVSLPPRIISWLSNATFEAWVTWNGPGTSVWQRVWDFGFNDRGTNATGIGTNYIIFSPSRGGTELMGFEETIVNPFGSESDPNSIVLYGNGPLPMGQPVYIAVTYDPLGGLAQLYINGALVNSVSKSLNQMFHFTDYNNYLGRSQWTRDPVFNGQLDEFRVWDGVLTAQDIADHYSAGADQEFFRVRPRLFARKAGNELVISWYTNYATGFQLQTATNAAAGNWVAVTNGMVVTNEMNQVRVGLGGKGAVYRLKK